MKLKAELTGEQHELSVKREGARVIAEVDGRLYELEAREPERGVYLLIAEGRVAECRVSTSGAGRGKFEVQLGGHSYHVALVDPKRLRGSVGAGAHHSHSTAEIIAPMPGKIMRVLAQAGARVEAGAGIVIVEAMKMQNEMKSPIDGIVVKMEAREGATVNAGEVLAVIEKEEE